MANPIIPQIGARRPAAPPPLPVMRALAVPRSGLAAMSAAAAIIAENLANAETTRTAEGGPYRRQVVTFRRVTDDPRALGGVAVDAVHVDPTPGRLVYLPGHPDADPTGYVRMPNVDATAELADLMLVRRLHEASATAFQTAKSMLRTSINIGR